MDNDSESRAEDLRYYQRLPLDDKVSMAKWRIKEFLAHYDGYVSFSGGKDSTVLAHLVHQIDPSVPLVFCNTGLEYESIQKFARKMGAEFIRPKMRFDDVISKYGYPLVTKDVASAIYYSRRICTHMPQVGTWMHRREVLLGRLPGAGLNGKTGAGGVFSHGEQYGDRSQFNKEKWLLASQEMPIKISHMCCGKMKKSPLSQYAHKSHRYPIIGTLAEESRARKQAWIRNGCNLLDGNKPSSQPLSVWTNQDILHYIVREGLEIAEPYGRICYTDRDGNDVETSLEFDAPLHCTGCDRTGCVYCMFGAHIRKNNRFEELARLSPRQYEYAMGGGQWVDNPDYDPAAPEYDGDWRNWNPKKIWVPSKNGLGIKFVIDEFNALYPNNKIIY